MTQIGIDMETPPDELNNVFVMIRIADAAERVEKRDFELCRKEKALAAEREALESETAKLLLELDAAKTTASQA